MALAEPVKIFDSTNAADGGWVKIKNFPSWGLQITGLEGKVWVEASNDPNVLSDGANGQVAAPSAPTVTQFAYTPTAGISAAGLSPAYTTTFKVTLVTPNGETLPSTGTAITVTAGNQAQVASPAADTLGIAKGYNVYALVNGVYVLQNVKQSNQYNDPKYNGPIALGIPYIAYNGIQQTNIAAPTSDTSGGFGIGVNISGNLGALAFTTPPTPTSINLTSFAETQIVADSNNGNEVMFNTSCLVFAFIRVRKDNSAQTKETIAWLVGQNS